MENSAAAVSDILSRARSEREHIAFFFCEYDNAESLKSRTILGSLIQQCLSVDTLSTSIESLLKKSFRNTYPDVDDLESILTAIVKASQRTTLVIDGFDECAQADRALVLSILQRLVSCNPNSVKVFISSREDMIRDIGSNFENCRELNMNCEEAGEDIPTYIKGAVEEKLENGELIVGDPELIEDIQRALIEGANGM